MAQPRPRASASDRPAKPARSRRDGAKRARRAAYRELVLEAAGEAFARNGVPQTKMEELAERAGLSLGTLYSVYRGKAEIVDALHEARLSEIHAASVDAEAAATDPLGALLAGFRAYIAYFVAHPDYLRLYLDEGTNWGVRQSMESSSRRAAVWNDGVARLAEIVTTGIEQGAFVDTDADRAVRSMLAMQQVRLADWEADGRNEDVDALVAEIEHLVKRFVCLETKAA